VVARNVLPRWGLRPVANQRPLSAKLTRVALPVVTSATSFRWPRQERVARSLALAVTSGWIPMSMIGSLVKVQVVDWPEPRFTVAVGAGKVSVPEGPAQEEPRGMYPGSGDSETV
jgi:hypothetical protein